MRAAAIFTRTNTHQPSSTAWGFLDLRMDAWLKNKQDPPPPRARRLMKQASKEMKDEAWLRRQLEGLMLWVQTQEKGLRGWWDGQKWTPHSAFASRKECGDPLGIGRKNASGDDPLGLRGKQAWTCLPDTVDPRGPKGK